MRDGRLIPPAAAFSDKYGDTNMYKGVLSSVAAAAVTLAGVAAEQKRGLAEDEETGRMSGESVSAEEILAGDFSTGMEPVGQVKNLILNRSGSAVEYVVFETRNMPWEFYVGDGYLSFNAVDMHSYGALGDIHVVADGDEPIRGPEELSITADEAERRLVSYITDSHLRVGDRQLEIEDLLIDPASGAVKAYVIGSEPDVLFSQGRFTVPAEEVEFEDGTFRTQLSMNALRSGERYETAAQ